MTFDIDPKSLFVTQKSNDIDPFKTKLLDKLYGDNKNQYIHKITLKTNFINYKDSDNLMLFEKKRIDSDKGYIIEFINQKIKNQDFSYIHRTDFDKN